MDTGDGDLVAAQELVCDDSGLYTSLYFYRTLYYDAGSVQYIIISQITCVSEDDKSRYLNHDWVSDA